MLPTNYLVIQKEKISFKYFETFLLLSTFVLKHMSI